LHAGRSARAGAEPRPEIELLLCCARIHLDAERATQIRALLRESLDWDALLRMGFSHGLAPLLYWNLQKTGAQALPGAVLERLRQFYLQNAQRNLLRTAELHALLKLLGAAAVPAIPFKGPTLACALYANLALRQFCDLDILVPRQEVSKAREILASRGYRPHVRLDCPREALVLRDGYECTFVSEDGRTVVGLHWDFTPPYFSMPLDPERLWGRLESVSLAGTTALALPPEDLLTLLCVHGSRHCWARLEWICTVAEAVRRYPMIDWARLLERVGRMGGERMVLLGLVLARDLLGAELPEEIARRTRRDPALESLAARVRSRLFRETGRPPGIVETALFHLQARERIRDRLRYCARLALTPTVRDLGVLPLPPFLSFVYYPLRPIRLAGTYAAQGLRRLLRRRTSPPVERDRVPEEIC
jgi:hypothetical protein